MFVGEGVMDWYRYLDSATEEPIFGLIALDCFYKTSTSHTNMVQKAFVLDLVERYATRLAPTDHVARGIVGVAFQLLPTEAGFRRDIASRIAEHSPALALAVSEELSKLGDEVLDSRSPPRGTKTGGSRAASGVPNDGPTKGSVAKATKTAQRNRRPRRDFGLVVPLGVERAAAEEIFGPLNTLIPGLADSPTLFQGRTRDRSVSLAVIQCAAKSQEEAAAATEFLATRVDVRGFILAGVAGSLRDSLKACDVVFGTGGFDDRLSRDTEEGHETEARSLRSVPRSASLAVADLLGTLDRDPATSQALMHFEGVSFHVDTAGSASTNTVVDAVSSSYRASVAGPGRNHSKFVEMEYAGFLDGLGKVFGRHLVPAAHIRGISDGAAKKDKGLQLQAAVHAMACLDAWLPFWAARELSYPRRPR